jgi:hypothetical protein
VGSASLMFTITEGSTTVTGIYAQALASSGSATVTASADNFTSGSGTITFSPSGFVLAGPNGPGVQSFSTSQGLTTSLTVSSARLDSSFNFVEIQQLRGGNPTSVPVSSSDTSVGTTSSSPLTINGGEQSGTTQFNAVNSGSTTVTASVPAGFNLPAAGANTMSVTVSSAGLVPAAVTVGQGLETTANVSLNGAAPAGGLTLLITSNDSSKVLFSNTSNGIGSTSITLTVPGGFSHTADFYVYGLISSGTATYTASADSFGSATGTVTLAPAGFVIQGPGPIGTASFQTTSGASTTGINVYPALLDSSRNFVTVQAVAGGSSVNVDVTSSNKNVGTITSSPVTIGGGSIMATTQFQPATPGNTTLSVGVPPGFSAPAQNISIVANVITPGIGLPADISIGQNLQQQVSFSLGQFAPAGGVDVTLTSNSTSQLLLSKSGMGVGSTMITVNVPAGSNVGTYYIFALGNSGAPTYTASASGYASRTVSVPLTPSAPVITLQLGTSFLSTTVAAGPTPFTVSMARLNSDNTFAAIQPLAGGQSVTVNLTNSNPAVGTIASSVLIPEGSVGVNTNFTPLQTGSTLVSVDTTATNNKSIFVQVK